MSAILSSIVHHQNAKIAACLAGGGPVQFWFAQCPQMWGAPEHYPVLQQRGFDNYPVACIPAVDAVRTYLFFFERLLGAEVGAVDGQMGDFFHSWCVPLIREPEDVYRLSAELDKSPLWGQYMAAMQSYVEETPVAERLPVVFPGFSPLDMACNLCGAEDFLLMLYEEPEAADHLLGTITDLLVDAYLRVKCLDVRLVTSHGLPGVYCSDLQMPYVSPPLLMRFLLPRYARIATACGGLCLALLSPDEEILTAVLAMDRVLGCAFDKRLPLAAIKQRLGKKFFLLPNYIYEDDLDKPTFHNGAYCNPIVQSYSRELTMVFRELADRCNMLISIERFSLDEVCAVRDGLRNSLP